MERQWDFRSGLASRSAWPVWLVAAATVVLHLVCIDRYGAFRDELYFLACAEHLDWGYVDQPPLVALVAWFARHVFGDSLLGIRILPVLANAGIVLITAAIARRLGANRFGQFLAALCAAIAPIYLAVSHFLSMNVFEPLLWMGCVLVAIHIFQGGNERLWLLFGLFAGLGLQNKQTTLFFGAAFFIALVLSEHRRALRRPWIWLGGAVAFLVFLPNLIWQWRHDFPTVELLRIIEKSGKNEPITLLSFMSGQIILMHPILLPVWIVGLVWLLRSRTFRIFGICFIALFALFVAMNGKIYYLAPIYPVLLAAGAVAIEAIVRARWARAAIAVVMAIAGAALVPMVVPILPVPSFIAYQKRLGLEPPRTETHRMGPLPQMYADMHGWPEMAAAVAKVYQRLTPEERARTAIFAQNYGQAGAIDFYGPALGLPKAISGHQNYFYWGPRDYTGEIMIVLDDDRETLEQLFDHVEEVGVVGHPYAMPYETGWKIHLCRGLKGSLAQFWPEVKEWI